MPSLLRELAVSGSRKSDGAANASGKVFLYSPGTTTLVAGYRDDSLSEAWTPDGGGIPLDAGGRVKIWINDMIDVVVTDADGATIDTMLGYNKTRAEQIEIENDNYTGELTDSSGGVSQDLGGKTDLQTVLSSLALSAGGTDGKYQESTGSTQRKYRDVVREIHITPQDFSAAGNGIRDDTASIVSAIVEVNRLGGGELYFPPGTYDLSSALQLGTALTNATGVTFRGAGSGATILRQRTGATGIFFAYTTGLRVKGMTLTHATTSTGDAVSLNNARGVLLDDVVTDGKFRRALYMTSSQNVRANQCTFKGLDADVLSRGVLVAASKHVTVRDCDLQGGTTGIAVEISTPTAGDGDCLVEACSFSNSAYGVAFVAESFGLTFAGTGFTIIGCPTLGDFAAGTAFIPVGSTLYGVAGVAGGIVDTLRQEFNRVDGYTQNITTGASVTPDVTRGRVIRYRGTTTGSAYLVAVPNFPPTTQRDYTVTLKFTNAAGGAVTGWTLAAGYKLVGAAMPVNTDLHTTTITFVADVDAGTGIWRELSRTDTLT